MKIKGTLQGPKGPWYSIYGIFIIRGLFNIKNAMFSWNSKGPFRVQKGPDDQFVGFSNVFVLKLIRSLFNIKNTMVSWKSKEPFRI